MSKKHKTYTSDFKTKVVLELLSGDLTVSQLASKYGIISKNILNWKKIFLNNANLVFNTDKIKADNKTTIINQQKEINELHRQLGKRTAELEWAAKKLQSLDFSTKKNIMKSELNFNRKRNSYISITTKCSLLNFNRSNHYYKNTEISSKKISILKEIDNIYSQIPFYGYRKVYLELKDRGLNVGINQVYKYMKELGLKAIYPTRKINSTVANLEHKKYPYLLKDLDINKPNQVWSTDITYIRVNGGFVYLAAIIDWYSKAILSHKISNTMDENLVVDVLKDALRKYGIPEIFNTDQGSQYTSQKHIEILTNHSIKISMDGKGRATDNIAIERFWRSAKYENIYIHEYNSIRELKNGVNKYIKFYNNSRFHQSINYQKPMELYNSSYKHKEKRMAQIVA